MKRDTSDVPIPARAIAFRVIDGNALLLDPNDDRILYMNDVGTFVWQRIAERGHSVEAIWRAVFEAFEVDEETARADVLEFVETLEMGRFVEFRD